MLFKDIIGQQEIKRRLIQTVKENRVSHAQLFLGPEGSGKLALAIAYAQYICCTNKKEDDSCGVCPSCVKYNKLIHPDLHFVYPVATTKEVTKKPISKNFISDWRELLLENKYYVGLNDWYDKMGIENKVGIINADDCTEVIKTLSLKSYESEYKTVIIWMVERLYYAAAPKLLKILEEPPPKTLFILISENHQQILNTIQSRTQLMKISKIANEEMFGYFSQRTTINPNILKSIIAYSNGNAIEVKQRLEESNYEVENFKNFVCLMRFGWAPKQYPELVAWVDEISKIGREKQKNFIAYTIRMIRDCYLKNLQIPDLVYMNDEEVKFANNFAPYIKNSNIEEIYQLLNQSIYYVERNANPKILFLDLALNIAKFIKS